ncbi:MAG: methyltransferase domain-containing protein [Alphaproteobacteria bacterium]|nr:methyltransferase domain-containing protein [Alphaproteobacteria bacterium]
MNMPNPIIFDKRRIALHHQRASEDFLLREMMERLADRLSDINRRFPRLLDLSPKHGLLAGYVPVSAGIEAIIDGELHDDMLEVEPGSFDLVMACGSLHWVNDLPGVLIQIQRALKPDGLFLAMLPGGETLAELRSSFEAAEMEMKGGISPRVSPFVDIRDAGALLQRAGFALPVVDSERLELHYAHPLKLLHELRAMGQANALLASQKTFTPCSLMMKMAEHYMQHFEAEEGRVRATFELLTLTAWKPHDSQQQPARRGSGKVNLSILSS